MIAGIVWIDWVMALVLLAAVIGGFTRGVMRELIALAGWLTAWFLAVVFSADVGAVLPVGAKDSVLNLTLSFLIVFFVVSLAWAMLARLLGLLVHPADTRPTAGDRLFGALAGAARGALLLLAAVTLIGWWPQAAQSQAWRSSIGVKWLHMAGAAVMG